MSPNDDLLPPLTIGSMLGIYLLKEELNQGGMGKLFIAEHTIDGHQVALKVMLPHIAELPKAKDRFFREAKLARSISNSVSDPRDRIVRILDVNQDGGIPFLAMELLRGESLDKRLQREPIPNLPFTLRMAKHIAEGLAIAHKAGLIHRDIKPANVWVRVSSSRHGYRGKVLDFGLARVAADERSLSLSGTPLGSPPFMSPEQWDGRNVDQRTDLFSLGVMLYLMISGRFPFLGRFPREFMIAICSEEPEPIIGTLQFIEFALTDAHGGAIGRQPVKGPAQEERHERDHQEHAKHELVADSPAAGQAPTSLSAASMRCVEGNVGESTRSAGFLGEQFFKNCSKARQGNWRTCRLRRSNRAAPCERYAASGKFLR